MEPRELLDSEAFSNLYTHIVEKDGWVILQKRPVDINRVILQMSVTGCCLYYLGKGVEGE